MRRLTDVFSMKMITFAHGKRLHNMAGLPQGCSFLFFSHQRQAFKTHMEKHDYSVLGSEDEFKIIGKEWMLVTAGGADEVNTMTASWGGMGWLWNKPVAFVFIRPERYTHGLIESNDRFSLSFYTEDYKSALQLCGSVSGRDHDKIREAGLTPVSLDNGVVTFSEARLSISCRKLFKTEMTECDFIDKDILARWYNEKPGGGLHTIYIAEIESVYTD